ncbi:uncharacterized protein MKZ38_010377 [Zalerion maritima]|uniref:DNA 3'-5' helicase n=1 Tax=Zalerion maritima TaxID=339359 RepID=A0AAD5WXC2_9PEZI|nr:uncharacterized protein MKZ38_010377 [Zalerion maritima]
MPPKRKNPPSAVSQAPVAKKQRSASPPGDDEPDDGEERIEESTKRARNMMQGLTIDKFAADQGNMAIQDSATGFFQTKKGKSNDFSNLPMKPDAENRPLYIHPQKGRIYLENFHPLAKQASDFLITIAEPLSRPQFIHEYKMTQHSLYAAVSVGLGPEDIVNTLDRFCKTPIPEAIVKYVDNFTASFGKLKMVLKNTKYYLESTEIKVLQKVLQHPGAVGCRQQSISSSKEKTAAASLVIPGTQNAAGLKQAGAVAGGAAQEVANRSVDELPTPNLLDDDDDDNEEQVFAFEVPDSSVETILQLCLDLGYPVLEEYDFRRDEINANLEIDLRPNINLRYYQEKSLSKMFGNGRAKSGIIVLPCGAGKTLVGITAACTIKKGCIVLCTSSMSAVQWRAEAIKFSNIDPADVAVFTSDNKTKFKGNTGIVVTTYSMITMSRERSHEAKKMMDFITQREWGLMLMDEVHVVPANIFRRVISRIKTHCKLGLTATLLREDDKIDDLNFLIGPKLYEANWMELSQQGHIARVQCAEVWCPMSPEFYEEYLDSAKHHRRQELIYAMNPNKFQACQYLIKYHESRGDKIIVFSDNIFALEKYARGLGKAYIYGDTPQSERMNVLENFQHNPKVNTLFLSKIGDTSLDLPEATVLIQISSQYGSRRQEAQRLGRILRAKRRNDEGFNAFFYSLVSTSTNEMIYSSRRQAFLVDQGYAFKVITELQGMNDMEGRMFVTPQERRELLQSVLLESEKAGTMDEKTDDMFHEKSDRLRRKVRRTAGGLGELSGGQNMAYSETNRGKGKKAPSSKFFKKVDRDKERKKLILAEESVPKPGQGRKRW